MKFPQTLIIGLVLGLATTLAAFFVQSSAHSEPYEKDPALYETAIFAGGCFWCVEADFDKIDGVVETISGYTGGRTDNPTYKTHSKDGHYEAVEVTYDPSKVKYEELVDYFFTTIDPTDPIGQFCDKGPSYRTAIFPQTLDERATAQQKIISLEKSNQLPAPIVTKVLDRVEFWPAETNHQDFYLKNYVRYQKYRRGCGRDARLKELWGDKGSS